MTQATRSGRFPCFFSMPASLAPWVVLTGALQPDEHNHSRRFGRNLDFAFAASHEADNFLMDDFNDLLGRSKGFQNFLADRPSLIRDTILHTLKLTSRFQKGCSDFAHCFIDIGFGQFALSLRRLKVAWSFSLKLSNIAIPAFFFPVKFLSGFPLTHPR
jgi:hypothetical protein